MTNGKQPAKVEKGKTDSEARKVQKQQFEAHFYEGPLPPPAVMQEYKEIVPGLPETIISLWEKQSEHRMTIEKQDAQARRDQLNAIVLMDLLGKLAAFVLILGLLAVSFYSLYKGKELGAIAAIAACIATIFGSKALFKMFMKKDEKKS